LSGLLSRSDTSRWKSYLGN